MDKKEDKKKPDKQVSNRDKTGKFIKGESGNPEGRPKISYMEQLNEAIKTVEIDKKKPLFIRFVEQAYANPSIMIALMGKLLANQQHTEIEGLDKIVNIDFTSVRTKEDIENLNIENLKDND